jgi:hypothetical protein
MAPAQPATRSKPWRGKKGYPTGTGIRGSQRLANKSGNVVKKKIEANKAQLRLPTERGQEVHEVKLGYFTIYPLYLRSFYISTGPGKFELQDVHVPKVAITPSSKNRVMEALRRIFQAASDLSQFDEAGPPSPLDRERDIIWDWHSMELSVDEYGAFAGCMVQYDMLRQFLDTVSYDFTPLDSTRGVLCVRKRSGFQSRVTRILSCAIGAAMGKTFS